ncbi:hypothetical protein TVAG_441590 [Trichomonas vaginalis G3]|uniref:Uncharacterized protein n=1 Tax=Trichomonas vaginalis (strain ATCC PRA-98 / G3) TaxID=412133 RepID=A2FL84_TRIV3|nr:hypothetical protein TVAGG3_0569630 [Trichomonas vaginalis G3]EAX94340.1 hypothetical protein TVAG_441590 [Trichomonas vaginalis G3]KAI5521823.1 hypothetical protein TVAGG3_0569630 [Trichomonas vaginalis G3]|eukprot:XP_001307270.1 hypothetical protein [Trichomonas vaginalis G3]
MNETEELNIEVPPDADVEALTQILKGMMSFSENLDSLYADATRELAKKAKARPKLELTPNNVILSVPPSYTWNELQTISMNVKKLSSRLHQMKIEQEEAQVVAKQTFADLTAERDMLLEKLESLRKMQPKRKTADELLRKIAAKRM